MNRFLGILHLKKEKGLTTQGSAISDCVRKECFLVRAEAAVAGGGHGMIGRTQRAQIWGSGRWHLPMDVLRV